MIQTLGHKYKRATGWLGNKVRDVRRQGAKVVNHPATKLGLAVAGATAGAVAKHKLDKVKETRTERVIRGRVEAEAATEKHKKAMVAMDPTGSKQKGLDEFVASKPFEAAFDFDAPF